MAANSVCVIFPTDFNKISAYKYKRDPSAIQYKVNMLKDRYKVLSGVDPEGLTLEAVNELLRNTKIEWEAMWARCEELFNRNEPLKCTGTIVILPGNRYAQVALTDPIAVVWEHYLIARHKAESPDQDQRITHNFYPHITLYNETQIGSISDIDKLNQRLTLIRQVDVQLDSRVHRIANQGMNLLVIEATLSQSVTQALNLHCKRTVEGLSRPHTTISQRF